MLQIQTYLQERGLNKNNTKLMGKIKEAVARKWGVTKWKPLTTEELVAHIEGIKTFIFTIVSQL